MRFIKFFLVTLSVLFTVTVLFNNLIDDAQSSVFAALSTSIDPQIVIGDQEQGKNDVAADRQFLSTQDPTASAPEKKRVTISGRLKPGDTFDSALRRDNVPTEMRTFIIHSLSDRLDFKRLKPLDTYTLQLDASGKLNSFRYNSGPIDSVSITGTTNGYKVQEDPIELERQRVLIIGEIQTSLFNSFDGKDEDIRLVYAFADIFASKIDFNTEVRKGDRYSIVVDKYYKDSEFVGYGKIQRACYEPVNGRVFEAYYYVPSDEIAGFYFDQNGQAVGTSFLRSPLPFGRVSSRFSYRRVHPVTGVIKPHLGIDLAAPRGTPIMAAADGTVLFIGRNNGNGNQIVLGHTGGYKTYYGHLSRFKKGLRRGDTVYKKDIIGYVGSTGIATGPHLDYRIRHNNVFKNPFSIEFKPKIVLSETQLADFYAVRNQLSELATINVSSSYTAILQVSKLTLSSSNQLILL